MQTTLARTLLRTDANLSRSLAAVVGAAALTAIGAQVQIPFVPVPFTLQTFAVLATALALGSRLAVASQATYLLAGAAGLPVFAGFSGGLAKLAGPTGGYLLGFVVASWIVGRLAERGWDRSMPRALAACALGMVAVYALGACVLSFYVGWPDALRQGVLPFVLADGLKGLAAATSLPVAWRLLGERD
ncbi:MAG: biotin transporter BioY [Fimbriimonadales bacterium]|nr:biotin transporter BioY [Fimbriimonadales bacterium]